MTFLSETLPSEQYAIAEIVVASVLGALGVYFLLPRPRRRLAPIGVFLCLASLVVAGVLLFTTYGQPTSDKVGRALFWSFAASSIVFGVTLVVQRNPVRGAIAFAFVVLSTSGPFLLLAAPFLMAATIIIYAGAIIVTFLFVLMLSHAEGPSDENDRVREPMLGSLAGFAFFGLVLFSLYTSSDLEPGTLPTKPITDEERMQLLEIAADLKQASTLDEPQAISQAADSIQEKLSNVVGYAEGEVPGNIPPKETLQDRLRTTGSDPRLAEMIESANAIQAKKQAQYAQVEDDLTNGNMDVHQTHAAMLELREDILVMVGRNQLPARNVSAIGRMLYSEHLLAVEMAGTLLLVATIGAVLIAQRKESVTTL